MIEVGEKQNTPGEDEELGDVNRELSWQLNFGSQIVSVGPKFSYPDEDELKKMQKFEKESGERIRLTTIRYKSRDTKLNAI